MGAHIVFVEIRFIFGIRNLNLGMSLCMSRGDGEFARFAVCLDKGWN